MVFNKCRCSNVILVLVIRHEKDRSFIRVGKVFCKFINIVIFVQCSHFTDIVFKCCVTFFVIIKKNHQTAFILFLLTYLMYIYDMLPFIPDILLQKSTINDLKHVIFFWVKFINWCILFIKDGFFNLRIPVSLKKWYLTDMLLIDIIK